MKSTSLQQLAHTDSRTSKLNEGITSLRAETNGSLQMQVFARLDSRPEKANPTNMILWFAW